LKERGRVAFAQHDATVSEHHRQLGRIADALGLPDETDSPTKTVDLIVEAVVSLRAQFTEVAQGLVDAAVEEEREACADIARDIFVGNTEIPRKDAAAWSACAEFICDEIRGRS
jgi:hypothetical protein